MTARSRSGSISAAAQSASSPAIVRSISSNGVMSAVLAMAWLLGGCGSASKQPPLPNNHRPAPRAAPKPASSHPSYTEECAPPEETASGAAFVLDVGLRGNVCAMRRGGSLECVHWSHSSTGAHKSTVTPNVHSFATAIPYACALRPRGIYCGSHMLYGLQRQCAYRIWREADRVCGTNAAGEVFCQSGLHHGAGSVLELGAVPPGAYASSVSTRCHTTASGEVHCSGSVDERGESGPPPRLSFDGATAVTAGLAHFCALTRAGSVYCWGRNERAQLAQADIWQQWTPVAIALPGPARAIASGPRHNCAALTTGEVYCWGDTTHGEARGTARGGVPLKPCPRLAKETQSARDKTVEQERFDERVPCLRPGAASVLVQVSPYRIEGVVAAQLAAGGQRTCALDETGQLACWGGTPASFSAVVGALQ